jgi:thymidine kinase
MPEQFELHIGPMASGKSTQLINIEDHHMGLERQVLRLDPEKNTRDNEGGSRNREASKAPREILRCIGSAAVIVEEANPDIITVDEAFMFEDQAEKAIARLVEKWLFEERRVYLSSLDVLGNGKTPEIITNLLHLRPKIEQYNADCTECGMESSAIFTIITDEFMNPIPRDKLNDVLVQGEQKIEYFPHCRSCYMKVYGLDHPRAD